MAAMELGLAADDPKSGLTVADLIQFVQQAEAHGVDPRTPVSVRVGFRQQLVRVFVKADALVPRI